MSIARKLWLGFGALLLIFLLTSLVIVLSERSTQEALDEIVRRNLSGSPRNGAGKEGRK